MSDACHALWIGPQLGNLERACLRSVLAQGHSLTLWCYEEPGGVPAGVKLADASEVLSRDRIIAHRGGSFSLFSNRFRYELQRRGLGLWLDCDVYLLAPLTGLPELVLAWEGIGQINNAVMRLPQDCPLLAPLLDLFDEQDVPPWLPWPARIAAWSRLVTTGRTGVSKMPWGSAGPKAITYLARRTGHDRLAMPPETFYPVPWQQAAWISDPNVQLEDVITPATRAVHLWNELVKGHKDAPAPRGSFLARLQEEGAPD